MLFRWTLLLTTCLMLSSCGTSEPKTHQFLGKYQVTCPASWSIRKDLNDQADFQAGNLFREAYMIILTEPASEFPRGVGLSDFADLIEANLAANIKNAKISPHLETQVNGMDAIHFTMRGKVEGTDVIYWIHAIKSPDDYHQVLQWSLASRFQSNRDDFRSAIHSFRTIGRSPQRAGVNDPTLDQGDPALMPKGEPILGPKGG